MMALQIKLFANSTAQGKNLDDLLRKVFSSDFKSIRIKYESIYDGDQGDMLISGLNDDIIIFDASVEDAIGKNYKAAHMWPTCMDHFLVVSRTRLPLNFQPFHEGGSPDTAGNVSSQPYFLNNTYLVDWILNKLEEMLPYLPRPKEERLYLERGQIGTCLPIISRISEKIISDSDLKSEAYQKSKGYAFISYLSRYSQYHRKPSNMEGQNVEDLIPIIRERHDNRDLSVLYYPPGSLSSEFMTEHRRWQVISIIEKKLRSAEEFWVFETSDYYNSWWTLAELACLSHMRHVNGINTLPKVFRYKKTKKGTSIFEADSSFIQEIEPKLVLEFGRCLSNCHPNTMGYETVRAMIEQKKLPTIMQWFNFNKIRIAKDYISASSPMIQEMLDGVDPEDDLTKNFNLFKEMLDSHVYTTSFWDDRIVSCPNCMTNAQTFQYDFSSFLYHLQQGLYRISAKDTDYALEKGCWICKRCNRRFKVIKEDVEQYKWWPVRQGKTTGPGGVYIEKIDVFSIE